MSFLADTNVISEMPQPRPNPKVCAWIDNIDNDSWGISVLTAGEVRRGINSLPARPQWESLTIWL